MTSNLHRECTRSSCKFLGFAESGGGTYIGAGDSKTFFPGCPMQHLDSEVNQWFSSYRWLKMGKTPMEMGVISVDEMDPRWFDAMELIDNEIARIQEENTPKPSGYSHGR